MFDIEEPGLAPGNPVPGSAVPAAPSDPVPLERLEAQLCEVAGHLAAATCRFLVLLAEFDDRRGWASWELSSCAAWLSWKCQMSSGTAREHIRVARALRDLPVIRREFAAGRLSYVKVRALTRIATAANEAGLAEIAGPMTGNQLERFARAHRQCSPADDAAARVRRRLTWRFEEDGSLAGTFRLPPLAGAVLLKALRAAASHEDPPPAGVSAETPPRPGDRVVATSPDLADALVVVAESFLAGKIAGADDAEVYQVVLHVGAGVIPEDGVSAETSPPGPRDPAHPADPARCHVEDGAAVPVTTADMVGCTAALSWMTHAAGGAVLNLGRRRRRPNAAIRKAARERDHGRCRYPGCESRRVDLHHIRHWSNGGPTSLDNLVSLCKFHHTAVHDRGCLIVARDDGTFAFCAPGGTQIPPSPALHKPDGGIADVHDAAITPGTITPPWYGERLDLDYAIYTCLANEQVRRDREAGRDTRPSGSGATVYGPLDPDQYARLRERLAGPPTYRPVQIPIQV